MALAGGMGEKEKKGDIVDTLEMTLASAFVLLRNASTSPLCNYGPRWWHGRLTRVICAHF